MTKPAVAPAHTSGPQLRRLLDVVPSGRFAGSSTTDVKRWAARTRRELARRIGLDRMPVVEPTLRITETVDAGDHVRHRAELLVQPGEVMPLYVLQPKADGPWPAVIALHGHHAGGKVAVAGVRVDARIGAAIDEYNNAYGARLAARGCLVFCPDSRGFGERREPEVTDALASSCGLLMRRAMPLGRSVVGMMVSDVQRLLDHIGARGDVEPGRIACVGLSGGGMQTLYAAALDQRIRAAVVSGYCYGVREALFDLAWNCECNYVPGLWELADHGDVASLIAPRPLLIETGDADALNGAGKLANVESQVRLARRVYKAADAAKALRHVVFAGPHRWHGEVAEPWVVERLRELPERPGSAPRRR